MGELSRQSTRGNSRGWSIWPDARQQRVWRWQAWCDGVTRTGTTGSQAGAGLLAQGALSQLEDDARRRSLRSV